MTVYIVGLYCVVIFLGVPPYSIYLLISCLLLLQFIISFYLDVTCLIHVYSTFHIVYAIFYFYFIYHCLIQTFMHLVIIQSLHSVRLLIPDMHGQRYL